MYLMFTNTILEEIHSKEKNVFIHAKRPHSAIPIIDI